MLFSSSVQRWEILKKHVELSIKSQSDTRWESRIKCIKPLRYNLKEVLLALKDLEAISIERKDRRAASETQSLIAHLSKWSFLLSVFIWYDILFQVNKASMILQSYGVSLHTMETEIQATEKFLQNYRTTGYDSAATSAVEIAQELDIDPVSATSLYVYINPLIMCRVSAFRLPDTVLGVVSDYVISLLVAIQLL